MRRLSGLMNVLNMTKQRMIGLVPEGGRLYYVAFVDRGKTRRVISLRFAERREVKHYVENYS